tara:strand:+ start:8586 stop:8870 length:285 start_codon:yes stop_codon:yes gene_type:complete
MELVLAVAALVVVGVVATILLVRRRAAFNDAGRCTRCGSFTWYNIGITPSGGVIDRCAGCRWVRILSPEGGMRTVSSERWEKIARRQHPQEEVL